MPYQSPADYCAEYAKANEGVSTDSWGNTCKLEEVTVVSQSPDMARVDVVWFACGHAADAGYFDVSWRTAVFMVKRDDGWHLDSEESFGYE